MSRAGLTVLVVTSLLGAATGARAQWVRSIKGPTCLAFSPDGGTVAAGAIEEWASPGDLRVWDVASGRLLHRERYLQGVEALAFSPDGRTLAVATDVSEETGAIRLWNLRSWRVEHKTGGKQYIYSIAYAPDGSHILSGSNMGENGETDSAYFWNLRTGKSRKLPQSYGLSRMLIAPRGGLMLGAYYSGYNNDDSENLRAWDASGRLLWRHPRRDLNDIAFEPGGRTFLVGMVTHEDDKGHAAPGSLQIWDARRGRLLRTIGQPGGVISLAVSRDGKTWASSDERGRVSFWNARTRRVFKTLSLSRAVVRGLTFSPDGRFLASAGEDDRVRLTRVPRTAST